MRYRFLRFPQGKAKALTLSYDDGVFFDERLIEIADRYSMKVTLNINSKFLGQEHPTAQELLAFTQPGGHEIAVHGAQHLAPGKLTLVEGIREVLDCRRELEQSCQRIIRGMAYPDSGIRNLTSGVTKPEIKQYLQSLGIAYARSLGEDNNRFELPTDFYEWIPTAHHENPNLMQWLDEFLNREVPEYCANREPKLFYLWGHSVEFHRNGNWERLEEFCGKAGGRKDIWYATNLEICDYVRAYQALIFDVDNTRVWNPTAKTVWFEADGRLITVNPGEEKLII